MVSAMIASKNIAEGIAAVARVPGATLIVAGDGPLREELSSLANDLLPGRFRQLTVTAAEMPSLYRSADVFMHLSVDELFGNVFVEALATGLPILAYDLPRTRWITGYAYYPQTRSTEALARALSSALSRSGTSVNPPGSAKQFGWSAIGARYHQFFRELL